MIRAQASPGIRRGSRDSARDSLIGRKRGDEVPAGGLLETSGPEFCPEMAISRVPRPPPREMVAHPETPGCSLDAAGSSLREMVATPRRSGRTPDAAGAEFQPMGAAPGRKGSAPGRAGVFPPPNGVATAPSREDPGRGGVSAPAGGSAPERNGGSGGQGLGVVRAPMDGRHDLGLPGGGSQRSSDSTLAAC